MAVAVVAQAGPSAPPFPPLFSPPAAAAAAQLLGTLGLPDEQPKRGARRKRDAAQHHVRQARRIAGTHCRSCASSPAAAHAPPVVSMPRPRRVCQWALMTRASSARLTQIDRRAPPRPPVGLIFLQKPPTPAQRWRETPRRLCQLSSATPRLSWPRTAGSLTNLSRSPNEATTTARRPPSEGWSGRCSPAPTALAIAHWKEAEAAPIPAQFEEDSTKELRKKQTS